MTDVLSSFFPESLLDKVPSCCGGVKLPFQGMDISLHYAIPKSISLSGFQLDVTLNVTNPNQTTLCTTGFSYKVAQKDGTVFAEGSMDEGLTLPGLETTQVVVPVNCSYGGVGSIGKSLLMGGSIDFVMSGETHYKIPMTETVYTLPYSVEGSFAPTAASKEEKNDTTTTTTEEEAFA